MKNLKNDVMFRVSLARHQVHYGMSTGKKEPALDLSVGMLSRWGMPC